MKTLMLGAKVLMRPREELKNRGYHSEHAGLTGIVVNVYGRKGITYDVLFKDGVMDVGLSACAFLVSTDYVFNADRFEPDSAQTGRFPFPRD